MAGGGKVRITDRDNTGEMARVVAGRLLVSTQGGGGVASDVNIAEVGGVAVGATVPVSGTVTVNQGTSPWTVDGTVNVGTVAGTVTVSGTVAATQSGAWTVGVSGTVTVSGTVAATQSGAWTVAATQSGAWTVGVSGTVTVSGTVAATQSGTWDIGTVTQVTQLVSITGSVSPGTGASQLGKAEDLPHSNGDVGVMALAVRNDASTALATTNLDYIPLSTDSNGRLWVANGTGKLDICKVEDVAHASGDVGVMTLAVRNDTLAALAGTTGDYIPLTTDSLGRLWVRDANFTTVALSGSTRGRPIQITATGTPGTTLHTATTTSGQLDRIYIWLANTSTAAVTVTIEFGTTGAAFERDYIVPANEEILAVDGAVLGGAATDIVRAYATTGSVVNASGRVERLAG